MIIHKHKVLTISFILLFIFVQKLSFSQKLSFYTNVTIKGRISNNNYKTIFFDRYSNEPVTIDSAAIVNNTFEINVNISETDFYDLRLAEDKTMILILSPSEKVDLTVDARNFQHLASISGSTQSSLVFALSGKLEKYQQKQDSLNQIYVANKENPKLDSIVIGLRKAFDRFADKQNKIINNFINNNLTSLSGLLFINRVNLNDYSDTYSKYDSALIKTYPNNKFVKDFHQQVTKNIRLAVGHVAPEVNEKDTTGKEIPLSSLRGKVVLIDFWASWCGPCRRESPHIVNLYKEYHDKGFEIYSISLDKSKESWLNAIRHDKLRWTHVSDFGYWNSRAAQLYNVTSIPYTVLLDRKGKIIAKGLFGSEIDQRLDMLFKSQK